jgi:NAD-dependent deacetylase
MDSLLRKAAGYLRDAECAVVFSGAGISVESGIPPFRGEGGFWSKYDPKYLELEYFFQNPKKSWEILKEIFYKFMADTEPNSAHLAIAELEQKGFVKAVITQNIDNLHQRAGSRVVHEFHGTIRELLCLECGSIHVSMEINLDELPPTCRNCRGVLKPNIIFFSEMIPIQVSQRSFAAAERADVMLMVGTTGEVMPAALIPNAAKEHNQAVIIEVNPEPSLYTQNLTDIFLQGRAGEILPELTKLVVQ